MAALPNSPPPPDHIPAGRTPAGSDRPDLRLLLEETLTDFQWLCVEIGVIASLVIGSVERGRALDTRALRHLLADNSKALDLALRFAPDAGISSDATANMVSLAAEIGAAKQELAGLMRPGHPGARRSLGPAHAQRWRDACRMASRSLAATQADTARVLEPRYAANATIIQRYLGFAAVAAPQCFLPSGVLAMPDLAQRRRTPRRQSAIPCRIVCGGASADGTIVDLSRSGMGVRCDLEAVRGGPVTLQLRGGRTLSGKVVRIEPGFIGVGLSNQLTIDDPLFRDA